MNGEQISSTRGRPFSGTCKNFVTIMYMLRSLSLLPTNTITTTKSRTIHVLNNYLMKSVSSSSFTTCFCLAAVVQLNSPNVCPNCSLTTLTISGMFFSKKLHTERKLTTIRGLFMLMLVTDKAKISGLIH